MRSGGAGGVRGRRGQPLAALVAVLALVVAACTGGDDEVPAQAAADAPTRTTSTTTAPPPGLERVSATASAPGAGGPSRFTDLVVGERAILVLGDADGRAAMWLTGDGATYDPVVLSPTDFPEGSVLSDVTVAADRYVVVGSDGTAAAAWTSRDARDWVRADLRGGTAVDAVLIGELGITAHGRDGGALVTWVSFDGARWERVPGGPDVAPGGGPARVVGAHDDGAGFVVVVDRGGVAEAWRSPDGRTWAPEPAFGRELLPATGEPRPGVVLGAGSATVVLGAVDDPDGRDAAVWSSLSAGPFERAAPSEAVFGGDGAQAVTAATQLGTQLVAVGTDTDVTGDVDAVVWSTAPTGGWQRAVEVPGGGLAGPGDQHPAAIAPTRTGALVVGWEVVDGTPRGAAWVLASGEGSGQPPAGAPALAWRRVPTGDGLGGPGEQRLGAVVATGEGFVAVGAAGRDGASGLDAAVWRSSDGVAWERVPDVDGALGGPGDQHLLGVAAGGPGLVAVGVDGGSAAVWTSADGGAWSRVAHDEAVFGGPGDQAAAAVVAGPDGRLVAVGRDGGSGDGDAAVWRALDGGAASWERVADAGDVGGPGPQDMAAVTTAGPLLVAAGSGGTGAAAWSSLDGRTWSSHDLGPGRAEAVAASEGVVVAVGSVAGAAGLDGAAWRSDDGRTWAPASLADGTLGQADQEVLAVLGVVGPDEQPLLAAVGRTGLGPGDDGAAWTSGDGAVWDRAPHDEDVFGGDQDQRMAGLAARGDVVVAVGWSGTDPADRDAAVWVTSPLGDGGGVL